MSTYVGKFITAVSAALEFNSATLSGAMDIVVIEDIKCNRKSTPFHVRFGKLQLLKSRGIPIKVDLNGRPTPLRMLLGAAGEAYFYNPPLETSSGAGNSKISQTFEADASTSLPLPNIDFKPNDESSSNVAIPHQSSDLALPTRSASLPGTKIHNQIPHLQIQPALLTSPSQISVNPQTSEPTLSPTTAIGHCDPQADDSVSASFQALAYASDSEVELSRNMRGDDPQFAMDAPLSPPLFPTRRSWNPTDTHSEVKQRESFQNSDLPVPVHVPLTTVVTVKSQLPSSISTSMSQSPASEENPLPKGLSADIHKGSPQSEYDPVLPRSETNEFDSTALFNLPATPSRRGQDSSGKVVTTASSMCDIVGEEERKLDARSLDSFDFDGNGYSSSTDGLQQRVLRILANDTALTLPQAFDTQGALNATEDIDVPTPDTDPPSDRDETLTLSLCGGLLNPGMQEAQVVELFERHRVTFDDFEANPSIVFHPSLRFRIENRIVELRTVAPFLVAALAFNERMNLDTLANVAAKEEENEQKGELKEAPKSPPTPRRFRWFGWSASPPIVGEPLLNEDEITALDAENSGDDSMAVDCVFAADAVDMINTVSNDDGSTVSVKEDELSMEKEVDVKATKCEGEREKESGVGEANSKNELVAKDGLDMGTLVSKRGAEHEGEKVAIPGESGIAYTEVDPEHLSLCPTADQLNNLDLETGANTLRFYVEGTTVELQCRIFLWECHSKIVISDVDGTITRSDVLGHLLPAVGRDWSQVGVAGLYTMIEKNGYKMLYLTARPIGQASQTREYLHNVIQGNSKLPNGPVLMSPNRLVESFTREVIRRRPHEFKISALREVRNLFSPDYNPFHAGFGNRDTDVISYRAVGLMPHRIFVVNPRGELVVMKAKFESTGSYSSLQDLVESVFPDITGGGGHEEVRALTENASYNDWNFWRAQLPPVDINNLISRS